MLFLKQNQEEKYVYWQEKRQYAQPWASQVLLLRQTQPL